MCRHVSLYSSYCQNFFLNTLATNGDRSRGRSCSRLQKEACIAIEHLHAEHPHTSDIAIICNLLTSRGDKLISAVF